MSKVKAGSRRASERQIVDHLMRAGTLSRAELATRTGLSPPTVGKVADRLISAGLLAEQDPRRPPPGRPRPQPGRGSAPLGRPGRPLGLEATTRRFVVLQLGVRQTRLAVLPVAGPVADDWPVHFNTPKRPTTWLRRLRSVSKQLKVPRPWAVALSAPGVVDERSGTVLFSPGVPWTEHADLVALVRKAWDVPVVLVQQVRALALGHLAARPKQRDFLLFDFGDNADAALVRHGRLYDGPLPVTGQIGHTPVPGNTRLCTCGAIGCVRTLVCRAGLLASFTANQTHPRSRPQTQGARRGNTSPSGSWSALLARVKKRGVEPWLHEALDAAATLVVAAMNLSGVNHLVVTGALSELPDTVMAALADRVRRSAMAARFGPVQVEAAPRRGGAGLVAAAVDRLLLPEVRHSNPQ